jgi:hypothetical protein
MSDEYVLFQLDDVKPIGAVQGFPPDWRYHATSTGYTYGCRCPRCYEARRATNRATALAHRGASPKRICKRCGGQYVFVPNAGAGTKYCADCKQSAYDEAIRRHQDHNERHGPCPGCAIPCRAKPTRWNLCPDCYGSIPKILAARLRKHHASVEFVLRVARWPFCEMCGVDIRERRRDNKGRLRHAFALDHDHSCCPHSTSCGKCLRGLLCLHHNTALGFLNDDPEMALSAYRYLTKPIGGERDGRTRTSAEADTLPAS